MNSHFKVIALTLLVTVFVVVPPVVCQQEKGDSEIGLSGSFTVPHSSPSDATGSLFLSYAYYFRVHDSLGTYIQTTFSKDQFSIGPLVEYRHLFPTKNPKVFPFVGVAGGLAYSHTGGDFDENNVGGAAAGEAGVKFFVSPRTAFDVVYYFTYNTGQSGFANSTNSLISFGLTHVFGRKH